MTGQPAATAIRHSESTFTNSDGMTLYHQQWLPVGAPKAAVMLWHGLGEHSGRYQHVAEALAAAGYAVYALDHRGHGKSDGKRVYIRSYDEYLRDLVAERSWVKQQQPDVPLVVVGHSMGGNLALRHTLDHQDGLTALVVSGPAIMMGDDISPAKAKLASIVGRIAPGFRPEALDANAISRDPAVVDAYRNDPLVYDGKITAGLAGALLTSMKELPPRYSELTLPVLVLHGTDDRLANVEGSRRLEAGAVNAPVTAHYYEGLFHEVFNEPEKDEVIGDLIDWLDQAIAPPKSASKPATGQPPSGRGATGTGSTTGTTAAKQASDSARKPSSAKKSSGAAKPSAQKAPAKQTAKNAASKKAASTKAASKQAAKNAASKKPSAKKTAAKKAAAKKTAAKSTAATTRSANAKRSSAKKAARKTSTTSPATDTNAAAARKSAAG